MNKIYYLILFLLIKNLFSQDNIPILDIQNPKYETSLEKFYQSRSVIRTVSPQVLDSMINENEYQVGPGDIFEVEIIGELELKYELKVLPEGTIKIPEIGQIKIKNRLLRHVKSEIKSYLKDYYRKGEIIVNLSGLRKFRVYLTGEVIQPGTYFVQFTDRVADILELSIDTKSPRGLTDWADNTRIEIRRKNLSTEYFDISKFYRNGDISQNPRLENGDIIFVPSINMQDDYVIVEGDVGLQGIYPLKPNEKLIGFLKRVSALNKRSDLSNIIVDREKTEYTINIIDEIEKYKDWTLKNKDVIKISTIYGQVYIRGEVANPGALPYRANYTVRDYVGEAGVLDSAVDEDELLLWRQESGELIKGSNTIVGKGDMIIVNKRAREVFKDYMTIFAPIISLLLATISITLR